MVWISSLQGLFAVYLINGLLQKELVKLTQSDPLVWILTYLSQYMVWCWSISSALLDPKQDSGCLSLMCQTCFRYGAYHLVLIQWLLCHQVWKVLPMLYSFKQRSSWHAVVGIFDDSKDGAAKHPEEMHTYLPYNSGKPHVCLLGNHFIIWWAWCSWPWRDCH